MKLLVTGGAGFIGSAVVRLAIERGHEVVNLDALTYSACIENLSPVRASNNYRFERVDIRDAAALERVLRENRPDAIVHLAAESHVDRSIDDPNIFVDTNVNGTATLLEAVRRYWLDAGRPANFRLLHVSTDEVFGSLEPDDAPFSETSRYDPRSPYAASKAASDHLVRAWATTYGLPVLITNCSNNYGPYQFPEKLIPVAIINALHNRPIPVYGTGENIRDWLFVEDHVEAILEVLSRSQECQTYNIGGGAEVRNIDLVLKICYLLNARRPEGAPHEALIQFVEDRPGHDARYAMDCSKIERELGWKPSVGIDEGLARTVDWYLGNENWWRPLLHRQGVGKRLGLII